MRFKRKRYHRPSKRGRGIPYIYQNRVNLGKKKQVARGAVSKTLGHILETVGTIIRLQCLRKKFVIKKIRRKKKKPKIQKGSGLLNGFKLLYSIGKQWRNSMQ